jgi:methyl-accepting chemotaxis protein
MNWLRNVKMKSKILFCFSLNAFLTVIVGLIAINYGDQLSQISLFTSIVIAAILLNLFLGLFLSGVIGRPLQNLIHSANNIAEGNFAVDLDVERQDEFGQLMTSFAKILTTTRNQAEAANKIASGDLDIHAEVKSDQDILSRSLK